MPKTKLTAPTVKEIDDFLQRFPDIGSLRGFNLMLRNRWRQLQQQAMVEFRIGQHVKFEDRSGRTIVGRIQRLNRKTVTLFSCRYDDGKPFCPPVWKVSPTILREVAQ